MTDSLQQFDKVFFEEVAEHLEEMESLLLDMDENDADPDALDAIFRAAHSIKGGAGIFGFDDISSVTHILENLLDKLRNDELTLTREMIDAFLSARDLLEQLKETHEYKEEPIETSRVKAVCDQLTKLSENKATDTPSKTAIPPNLEPPVSSTPAVTLTLEDKAKMKVLLVEDSKVNQMVANFTLKKLGFEDVEVAEDGQQTLDKLNASLDTPFDLILLDCQMPIMDGYQATKEIRLGNAGDVHTDIAIIAMTAMAGDKEKDNCLQAGMDDYLLKPINGPLLEEKISLWYAKITKQAPVIDTKVEQKIEAEPAAIKKPAAPRKKRAKQNEQTTSIRVNTDKVDQLINQVGELIITQSMLQKLMVDLGLEDNQILATRLNQLESNTRDLQASVMSVRMMPISTVFGRFPRVIRDLSSKLGKKIKLVIEGEQTELDKGLIEMLADPLTHLIRNSIDHGIEMPADRLAKNKEEEGTIKLAAFYRGGDVVINVEDNGGGINPKNILDKARKNGMELPDNMSDSDIFQLIFSAGFSTAEVVTDVSGRGVGMDVVKRNISEMGGRVEISSVLGEGSVMSIRLPLTLAIIEGMSISVGDQVYIIPLTFIVESLQPKKEDLKILNGTGMVVKIHDEYIPILALHQFFNIDSQIVNPDEGIIVLLEHENKQIALFVDSLIGQQQVVLKNLEHNFKKVPCISGATIMGDGKVSLILDVPGLVNQC